jgi:hypothetical protein
MAEKECCYTCVYSYLDRQFVMAACFSNFVIGARPSCANHPQSLGRMRPVRSGDICPNYRPKPATPEGEVKQIPLGDGYYAYVDAADHEWLSQWTWHLHGGYAVRVEKGKTLVMHREIMKPPVGMIVHHKNRNKLDDTRGNLEICTPRENAYHRPKRRGTSSRFRGVSRRKKSGKCHAQICYKGEQLFLGLFTDEIEAARAHDGKAIELFGEHAHLNFPDEWPPERRAEVYALHRAEGVVRKSRRKRAKPRRHTTKKGQRKTQNARRPTKSKRTTGHRSRTTTPKGHKRTTHDESPAPADNGQTVTTTKAAKASAVRIRLTPGRAIAVGWGLPHRSLCRRNPTWIRALNGQLQAKPEAGTLLSAPCPFGVPRSRGPGPPPAGRRTLPPPIIP